MPIVNKITGVAFIGSTFFPDVKSSLRFRRPGASDDLEIRTGCVGDDFGLPLRHRCDVNQVRTHTESGSARLQKTGRGLQRDTAGRHQPKIGEWSFERLEVAGPSHRRARENLDE